MLQFDLTNTRLVDANSDTPFPTEAETFVITVGLLLVHEAPLSALRESDLVFRSSDAEALALCIEGPLAALAPDFGAGQALRDRLTDFVGMCISDLSPQHHGPQRAPR